MEKQSADDDDDDDDNDSSDSNYNNCSNGRGNNGNDDDRNDSDNNEDVNDVRRQKRLKGGRDIIGRLDFGSVDVKPKRRFCLAKLAKTNLAKHENKKNWITSQ